MLGMLAVSRRMNELIDQYPRQLGEKSNLSELEDMMIVMGVLFIPSSKIDTAKQLIYQFIKDIQNLSKENNEVGEFLISLSLHHSNPL